MLAYAPAAIWDAGGRRDADGQLSALTCGRKALVGQPEVVYEVFCSFLCLQRPSAVLWEVGSAFPSLLVRLRRGLRTSVEALQAFNEPAYTTLIDK